MDRILSQVFLCVDFFYETVVDNVPRETLKMY